MDVLGWLILALALIAIGGGLLLYSRGAFGYSVSMRPLRMRAAVLDPIDAEPSSAEPAKSPAGDPRAPIPLATRPQLESLPDPWRDEMRRAIAAQETWLARLDAQVADLSRRFDRRIDELIDDIRVERTAAGQRQAAIDARQEAALERLRADMLARLAQGAARPDGRIQERRAEVTAELYAALARLEAAFAAVTNPALLPGEAYAPPEMLQADALVWDNWKDVGERAFVLADAYSAQRLFLSAPTRQQVDRFVSSLRAALTGSIYANLQAPPTTVQARDVRTALEELAAAFPEIRAGLEWEFRAASEPGRRLADD
ncbi:MAG TPA: hypothetical protein VFQ80_16595 [Thermomicrobiales bacterium]|nr:hypothetical protein [Thermomicrobiales bacterium]